MLQKIYQIPYSYLLKIKSFFYHFKKPFVQEGKYGIKYLIDPRSALDYHIIKYGILNDFIANHLSVFIPDDGIAFDIGANVGLISIPLAKQHLKEGTVFSYEPDNENFSRLLINSELNSLRNIKLHKIALQDDPKVKQLSFFVRRAVDGEGNNNLGLSSLGNPGLHTKEEIQVPASTLDNEVKTNKINRLDFIKIDVEGFEYEVLKGGRNSIKEFQPIIQYEFSPILDELLDKENCLDCFNFIQDMKYTQYRIIDEKCLQSFNEFDNKLDDCNVLCFPPNGIPRALTKFIK